MNKIVFLTDLDDTLFSSAREGEMGPHVMTAQNGPHNLISPAQDMLFAMMRGAGEVIPVTARSSDAFARVHLDFGTQRAILANGAILLDEKGLPDQDWFTHTAAIGRKVEEVMEGMVATIGDEFGGAALSWIVREYGEPVYFCVKMTTDDPEASKSGLLHAGLLLEERFDLSAFQQHVTTNSLSYTPVGISKRDASLRLISTLGERDQITLVGAGDSLTDVPFMRLCDFMLAPSGSQIAREALRRSLTGDDGGGET